MSSFLLLILILPWQTRCQRPHDLQARSTAHLYQYEDIALEQGFKNLVPCAADCLFKPCYGNSTCEATKHSVDFELGCIASTCVCDATRFKKEAETYIPTCVQKHCDNNQTLVLAALEVLQQFCSVSISISSSTTIPSSTISLADGSTTITSSPSTIIDPTCNRDTVIGSIYTQDGSLIPAFPKTMPGCPSPWSPPEPTETTKPPHNSPRGLTPTGRNTLYGTCIGAALLTGLNSGVIWYIWYR